jgi:hypothetical protein
MLRVGGVAGEVHDHAVVVGLDDIDAGDRAGRSPTAVVIRPMPPGSESSWTRMVMEEEAFGAGMPWLLVDGAVVRSCRAAGATALEPKGSAWSGASGHATGSGAAEAPFACQSGAW